jgi:hypothetical protein
LAVKTQGHTGGKERARNFHASGFGDPVSVQRNVIPAITQMWWPSEPSENRLVVE